MLDANGRPIEVGDTIATPYSNGDLIGLPQRIKDATLGRVIKISARNGHGGVVHIGDSVTYKASEIVTLSGLEFVICLECGFTWPFDVRMNVTEECPDCGVSCTYNAPPRSTRDWELEEYWGAVHGWD